MHASIHYDFTCLCVCEWRKWDVRGAGLDYSDARPSYFNLFTEPRTPWRMFELEHCRWARGMGWNPVCSRGAAVEADAIGRAAVEADAIGEQQSKRTRSIGSSSWSCKRRAAAEAGAIGEQQLEAEANGEQQWKRMPQSCPRAAAEANASGEKQLKWTQSGRSSSSESCPAPDYAR